MTTPLKNARQARAASLVPTRSLRPRGFTLIEIVLVLTLLTIIVGASVPSFRGLKDEQIAREPVTALARMAKETRLHAMKEKRPYQIAFTSRGFTATRYLSPYVQAAQLEEFVLKAESDSANLSEEQVNIENRNAAMLASQAKATDKPVVAVFHEWTQRYVLPPGVTYGVQEWHEAEALPLTGEVVKLWVFQPSGVVQPITLKLEREAATFEAGFSALTADIVSERSDLR